MVGGRNLNRIEFIFIKHLAEVMNKHNIHLTIILISYSHEK